MSLPSSRKHSRSNAKSSGTPVCGRQINAVDDLLLLTRPNQEGGIVHALQPLIVPEIITRIGMRWWNCANAPVPGNVVRNAVINQNLGNFGGVFNELHSALPKSLKRRLVKLRMGHGHASKHHRDKMADGISSLFSQTADPQTIFVKTQEDSLQSQ